ncbi:MAG: Tn7 transposase TnsA N-terminal domain-containing protein [Lachnospiraceae bacterium]|nr:Tn7 transposase TnsA N-terminal domain-containing protein [Lachnospiraceae bacterium]MBQ6364431.1 Tn7 transposase TnsA N-terminal domain-containing protein [Lachnospiraceae bacterium]
MSKENDRIIRLMKRRKRQVLEGRGTGGGPDYVPLLKANEARSIGTACMIQDPIASRTVHVMSTVEKELFYLLRWNQEVEDIREQYLMDMDKVSIIAEKYGLGPVNKRLPYTLDFLVTYRDKSRPATAYSVKASEKVFRKNSREYRGNEKKYRKIMNRITLEKIYWEEEGCEYKVIVSEDINHILASNIELVMNYYDRRRVINTTHKLIYLIAHRYVDVPLDKERLKPNRLICDFPYCVDQLYEAATAEEDQLYGMHY